MILLEFESRIISETLTSRFEQIGGEKVTPRSSTPLLWPGKTALLLSTRMCLACARPRGGRGSFPRRLCVEGKGKGERGEKEGEERLAVLEPSWIFSSFSFCCLHSPSPSPSLSLLSLCGGRSVVRRLGSPLGWGWRCEGLVEGESERGRTSGRPSWILVFFLSLCVCVCVCVCCVCVRGFLFSTSWSPFARCLFDQ